MSFKCPNCRAFSRRAERILLLLVSGVTLTALGVLLHSIWVLRP